MAKKWQKKELSALQRDAAAKSLTELAQALGREEADVESKLKELGLEGKSSDGVSWYNDPVVDQFEQAMKHLHAEKWAKAKELLDTIVESSDVPEVAERARLMLRVCEARLTEAPELPEDPFLAAVFEKNRGNYAAALKLCKQGGRSSKDERFAYLAASIHALTDEPDEAVSALQAAVQLNPKNRVYAFHDPDFESVLDLPELERLFEAS